MVTFDENLTITPKESITKAKGKPKHTGGGAGANFVLEIEPEEILPPLPCEDSLEPNDISPKLIVGIVDMGIDFSQQRLQNFNLMDPMTRKLNSYNTFVCNELDIYDQRGHGTHIAGIITIPGQFDPPFGVNLDAQMGIYSVKITERDKKASDLRAAVCGIKYAVDNGAQIINLSWGFYKKLPNINPETIEDILGPLAQAIRYAKEKGVLIVAAAGNDAMDTDACHFWPAGLSRVTGFENVLSVAALNMTNDGLADFSNFGKTSVQIVASGTSVSSLDPNAGTSSTGFRKLSGTSMAAPFVTKLAAYYFLSNPGSDYSILKSRILKDPRNPILSYSTRLGTPVKLVTSPVLAPLF
ncbi:MAG: S8 family serine peptidase [Bacteroidota bacterium]